MRPHQRSVERRHRTQERHHERVGGRVVNVCRRTDLLDTAFVEYRDPVGHVECLGLVVRHQHGGDVHLVVQPAQPRAQILADLCVQRAERLVEQQHLRVHSERARQRHPLPLPAGQLVRIASLEAGEADHLEEVVHLLLDLGLRPLTDAQAESDIVANRQMFERRVVLEHEADATPLRRNVRHIFTVDGDGSGIGLIETGDGPQQRRLARSAGPEQCGQ